MDSIIETFVSNSLKVSPGSKVSTKVLSDAYIKFNKGSSTGRNKLYAYLKSINGVNKTSTHVTGVEFSDMPVITTPVTTPVMSAFELAQLELARETAMAQLELAREKKESEDRIAAEMAQIAREKKESEDRHAAEMAQIAREKKESEERIAAEMAQIAREKKESEERIAREKKESDERMGKMKEEFKIQRAINLEKSNKEIEEMKEASKERLRQIDLENAKVLKQMDQDFYREENNKNRQMYLLTNFNKYIDPKIYGTPSKQYITAESLRDIMSYDHFDKNSSLDNSHILDIVEESSEVIPIIKNGLAKEVQAIDIQKLPEAAPESLRNRMADVPAIATRDENRNIASDYDLKKETQKPLVHKTPKQKTKYVKAQNNIRNSNGKIVIDCYCCSNEIELESSGCHRAHDISQADGGDWSNENVFLTCSSCNHDMEQLRVVEYKTQIYAKLVTQDLLNKPESHRDQDTLTAQIN
jgi:5-methylcytosine-specific restriction endonuclease McrA